MKICKENYVSQLRLHNGKALEFFVMEQGERLISIIRKHLFTLPHLQQECLLDTGSDIAYHNMYDLLNRIDTDIFEYEREQLAAEEKEELCRQLQSLLKEKKRRFSLKKYFGAYFLKVAFMAVL